MQFFVWTVVVLGLPVVLLQGPRLRSRFGDDVARAMPTYLAVGAAVIFFADVPLLHSSRCAMSPGATSLEFTGIWWLPNAIYSAGALLAAVRYVEQPYATRAWILPPWIAVALVGAIVLEGSTRAQPSFPWWGGHALFQLILLPSIWIVFRRNIRRAVLVLPVFAALLPFGPWSFWHACVRLRSGDTVEDQLGDGAPPSRPRARSSCPR